MPLYSGYAITDQARFLADLELEGIVPYHQNLHADHVTYAYPATVPPPPLTAFTVTVTEHLYDQRVQTLAVRVDGLRRRPDGRWFHITLSTAEGVEPQESNRLLSGDWTPLLGPRVRAGFIVPVAPFLRETA